MGELSTARELGAALALGFDAAAVVFVGWRVGRRVGAGDRLLGALAGVLAGLATAIGTVLLLAVVGVLSLPALLVVHALAAGAAWRFLPAPLDLGARPSPHRWGWLALAVVAGAAGYVALGVELSIGPPSSDFDTREYHITNLATWLQDGDLWDLPYESPSGVSSTHPGDAELLGVWLALPSHGDELVYVTPVAFGALALLAGAALARELGRDGDRGRAALGGLAALAVVLAPLYLSTQVGSLSTDITVAACVTAGLAFLVAASKRGSPAALVGMAGVALGLGLGSKYTALVPTFAVIVLAVLLVAPRRRWWWLAPGLVALAGPWFVRNLVATGNPLFPQELGPIAGSDSPFSVVDDTMLEHLLRGHGAIVRDWLDLGARFVGPAAVLALGGVVVAGLRRSRAAIVVAVVAVVSFGGYLAIPYSGGGPVGFSHLIASSLRYAMTAILVGAVLLAGVISGRAATAAVAVVLAVDVWRLRVLLPDERPDLGFGDAALARAVVVGLVVAAVVSWVPNRTLAKVPASIALAATSAVVAASSFVVLHRDDRGDAPSALEAALVAHGGLDDPVVPLGVVDLRSMLGPRLDRTLVAVSRGGKADEIPFATHDQVRRVLLGDTAAPAAPAALGTELDAALRTAPASLLAIGPELAGAYPEGWAPDPDDWCALGSVNGVALFARCTA